MTSSTNGNWQRRLIDTLHLSDIHKIDSSPAAANHFFFMAGNFSDFILILNNNDSEIACLKSIHVTICNPQKSDFHFTGEAESI